MSDHTVKSQGGGEKFKRIEDLFGGAHCLVADALQLHDAEVPIGRLGGEQPTARVVRPQVVAQQLLEARFPSRPVIWRSS